MGAMKNDVIVVGAGLVGASIALLLVRQGLRVTLLEQNLPDFTQQKNDRPLSLAYGSQQILSTLGVWPSLIKHACAIEKVHVSEQGRFGLTQFMAEEMQVPALGYVVSFNRLHRALYEKVMASDIRLVQNKSIKNIHCDELASTLFIETKEGDQTLKADLIIAADGTLSHCRELMGIGVDKTAHHAQAVIANLVLSEPHQHCAYERFTKQGTLAILPLHNDHEARLVWTLTDECVEQINALNDDQFLEHVQTVFAGRLDIQSLQRVTTFPLQTTIAKQQISTGFVLLGNAAHTIFPVAAQGFNLGLRGAYILSRVLAKAIRRDQAIGSLETLKGYEQLSLKGQKKTRRITAGLVDLFDLDLPGFGKLRGAGLLGLELMRPLKQRLAKRLMGYK